MLKSTNSNLVLKYFILVDISKYTNRYKEGIHSIYALLGNFYIFFS